MKAVFSILFISIIAESLGSTPIPFSGKLSVADVNFNGSVEFAFSISDSENKVHWRNGKDANSTISIFVQNGRYTALLGGQGMNPLPPELFLEKKDLSLQVSCDLKDGHGLRIFEEKHSIGAQPFALASELSNLAMRAESANTVANGSITRESLSEILQAELNATIGRDRLSQEVLNSLGGEIVITRNMLPKEVRDELNATITRERLSEDVVADLNRTIGVANLSKEVTDKLNQTFSIDAGSITLDQLSEQVRDDINGAITRDRLSSDLLLELNRTITMSMLSQDVLDELNTSSESSSGTTGPQTEVADGSIGLSKLSSEVSNALKPVVVGQPSSVVGVEEQTAVLDVNVDGVNLSYQWKKDGVDIAGATNDTLSIADLNASQHEGNYTVVVSNGFGSVTSSVAQVDVNGSLTEGLVGWWKFDETEGNVASDSSGNGNDGNLTNGPTWTEGKIGGALSFDGVDDHVNLGNVLSSSYTKGAWVKKTDTSNGNILSFDDSHALWIKSTGYLAVKHFYSGSFELEDDKLFSINQWMHVCSTYEANTQEMSLLKNGSVIMSTSNVQELGSNIQVFAGKFKNWNSWTGLLDDIRIYDRALSAFEVKALYELGEEPVQESGSGASTVVNGTVADGSITTNQLSEQILKYLKPEITQQPTAGTIYADTNHTISVTAEGKYLTYQWKKNGVNLAGETNATLTITDANATQHDGNYSVVVSNDFGSVESEEFEMFISTWVPSSSENLEIWLDATEESTIVQSLNLVSLWKDKSNLGNDASQNTTTYQPTYSLDGMSGFPGIKFDSDKLQFSNNNLLNKMCFAVINPISFQTSSGIILSSSSNNVQLRVNIAGTVNSSQGKILYTSESPLYNASGFSGVINYDNFISVNENSIIGFIFDDTFGFSTNGIYLDSQVSRNSSGGSTYNQIGMREGTYEPFDGHIGEIIIINSVQVIERQKVEGYLAHKWGIESKLPSNHPYKNSAP